MECCYPGECREYSVTPVLVAPNCPTKCCEDPALCYPCLPRCPKGVMYCCEKKRPKTPPRSPPREDECCMEHECYSRPRHRDRPRSPPPTRHSSNPSPPCCTPCCHTACKPVKTKYVIPCYRYEDGRIVKTLPVTAFKRNGMQDQEHSKMLGTTNFLVRYPHDVSIECEMCTAPVNKGDPAKVPKCSKTPLGCCFLRKKPIEVSLEDILDD